ncbi:MAG: VENN motif pre-toxin domain-containing protein [Sulfurovum sp.]|nr:VENN motif pre-toxin domain-containing protein [Sulfurovum sp.]MDD3499756.1 VENN motif pre-toxin domain-containing protein [Sulfurovum sp.]
MNEQSGVVAGDGGYQVTVAEHTDLKGGIITSTQKAEAEGLNSFSTGILSVSDVENHMHYEGDSIGISATASYSFNDPKTPTGQTTTTDTPKAGQQDDQFGFNKSVGYGSEGESQTSVTTSGINTQNITITDNVAQTATGTGTEEVIAQVHTDTTTDTLQADSGALVNNFDAAEVQKELDVQTRVTQTFDTTRQEVKAYLNTKIDDLKKIKENPDASVSDRIKAEMEIKEYEKLGVLIDSISGALYTPSDSIAGTIANTLSPAIVYEIGQYFKRNELLNDLDNGDRSEEGSAAHILAQALAAGIVAQTAGNDALSAAISAGGAEVLAPELSRWLYGEKDLSKLDADQKQTISAILSLGSSAISAVTGGSSTDIAASGMASSVAVEDNRQVISILGGDPSKTMEINIDPNTLKFKGQTIEEYTEYYSNIIKTLGENLVNLALTDEDKFFNFMVQQYGDQTILALFYLAPIRPRWECIQNSGKQ